MNKIRQQNEVDWNRILRNITPPKVNIYKRTAVWVKLFVLAVLVFIAVWILTSCKAQATLIPITDSWQLSKETYFDTDTIYPFNHQYAETWLHNGFLIQPGNNYMGNNWLYTELFELSPDHSTASPLVWWDLRNLFGADWLNMIVVKSADGTTAALAVPWIDRFNNTDAGDTVTIDGLTQITSIAFYGNGPNPLSENGSTLHLLGIAMLLGAIILTIGRWCKI
jgi:hypothetical protein